MSRKSLHPIPSSEAISRDEIIVDHQTGRAWNEALLEKGLSNMDGQHENFDIERWRRGLEGLRQKVRQERESLKAAVRGMETEIKWKEEIPN